MALSETELAGLVSELEKKGLIQVNETKVTYSLPE